MLSQAAGHCNAALLLLALLLAVPARAQGVDANYLTRADVRAGQLFPGNVTTCVGETIFVRVLNAVDDQVECTFRRPGGTDVSVFATPSIVDDRVSAWPGHPCGIRVENAKTADAGHWRLTSSRPGNLTRGYSFVTVQVRPIAESTDIRPLESADESITPAGTQYCYVLRPELSADDFPPHDRCSIPVDGTSSVQSSGLWNVVAGVDGQMDEQLFTVNLAANVEDLNTTVRVIGEGDTATIQLSCNLLHSPKTITFCRFLRSSDGQGFNVKPGQGNARYSYAGAGLEAGECGLSIVQPNDFDRFMWKCFVGYRHVVENRLLNGTLGAILDASVVPKELDNVSADVVYGLNGTAVNILCKAEIAVDFCWFMHPLGKRISVSDRLTANMAAMATGEDNNWSYYGAGLRMGECGVTVREATLEDTGLWQCHLGTVRPTGWETSRTVSVRVSESHLVASELQITVPISSPLSVDCTTIPIRMSLQYCRFVMPDGRGFSINEQITQANALDGIFFDPNRRLNDGYCSIIVQSAEQRHAGRWTCAALLVGRDADSSDDFYVTVTENGYSTAALSGIIVGALLLVAIIMLPVGIWSYRRCRRLSAEEPMAIEMQEAGAASRRHSQASQ